MLEIKNLKKTVKKREILTGISYTFKKGKIYPILGKSGSGKTTLLQCISGDLSYDSGEIHITGGEVMLAQKHSLWKKYLTGYEFLQLLCAKDETADEYFDRVHIDAKTRHKLIKSYDFITKKRLQLAMFLIQKPEIFLFDEPFDYCDDEYIKEFLQILDTLKEDHIVLISTGLLNIAKQISPDLVMLNNGELNWVSKESLDIKEIEKAIEGLLEGDEDEN